jgi:hypothetical protein
MCALRSAVAVQYLILDKVTQYIDRSSTETLPILAITSPILSRRTEDTTYHSHNTKHPNLLQNKMRLPLTTLLLASALAAPTHPPKDIDSHDSQISNTNRNLDWKCFYKNRVLFHAYTLQAQNWNVTGEELEKTLRYKNAITRWRYHETGEEGDFEATVSFLPPSRIKYTEKRVQADTSSVEPTGFHARTHRGQAEQAGEAEFEI